MIACTLIIGFMFIGYLIPDLCLALGGGKRCFPRLTNIISCLGFGFIGAYISLSPVAA